VPVVEGMAGGTFNIQRSTFNCQLAQGIPTSPAAFSMVLHSAAFKRVLNERAAQSTTSRALTSFASKAIFTP